MLPPSLAGVRLLHTSDWHLGRSFHQVGLLDAQARFLDHLVEVVRRERVDAVLVAGDVYDRALPSPDAVALLSGALHRLVDAGAQVVLTGGNHDSAPRLGFGSALMARAGVHVRTRVEEVGEPVLVGDTAIWPLPYLEPSMAAEALEATERTHAGVLSAAMRRVHEEASGVGARRHVVMAHAFVAGGVTSDSERDISVGGVSAVPLSTFNGVDYVALGHLHGRQTLSPTVRYSGSPVAMSFSETGHVKGSWLVDLAGDEPAVDFVEAPVERRLAQLKGELDDLLDDAAYAADEEAWCQVTLTDPVRPMRAMERLRQRFPHALELRFEPQGVVTTRSTYAARVASRSPVEVCADFLEHVRAGVPASPQEREMVAEAFEGARRARQLREGEGGSLPVGEAGVA